MQQSEVGIWEYIWHSERSKTDMTKRKETDVTCAYGVQLPQVLCHGVEFEATPSNDIESMEAT